MSLSPICSMNKDRLLDEVTEEVVSEFTEFILMDKWSDIGVIRLLSDKEGFLLVDDDDNDTFAFFNEDVGVVFGFDNLVDDFSCNLGIIDAGFFFIPTKFFSTFVGLT